MAIHVTDDPDVYVTGAELRRYQEMYEAAYMMFCGKRPTLAEFIRRKQAKAVRPMPMWLTESAHANP
jgi:hypothetical protein